jgi:catechol 2,3-dioxygenase-like lactoylglutathione lyase family enzyme
MALQDCSVGATVAVEDMARAKEFYEGKLGLSGGQEEGDGGVTYYCGDDTRLHIFPSPGNSGHSGATVAGFQVEDVDGLVEELSGNGVTFEQYDTERIKTNEKGIADLGNIKVAWMKDPDGNILGLVNR